MLNCFYQDILALSLRNHFPPCSAWCGGNSSWIAISWDSSSLSLSLSSSLEGMFSDMTMSLWSLPLSVLWEVHGNSPLCSGRLPLHSPLSISLIYLSIAPSLPTAVTTWSFSLHIGIICHPSPRCAFITPPMPLSLPPSVPPQSVIIQA